MNNSDNNFKPTFRQKLNSYSEAFTDLFAIAMYSLTEKFGFNKDDTGLSVGNNKPVSSDNKLEL